MPAHESVHMSNQLPIQTPMHISTYMPVHMHMCKPPQVSKHMVLKGFVRSDAAIDDSTFMIPHL